MVQVVVVEEEILQVQHLVVLEIPLLQIHRKEKMVEMQNQVLLVLQMIEVVVEEVLLLVEP